MSGETIAATGHRPPRLGGYGEDVCQALLILARQSLGKRQAAALVVSGMALGWDQAIASAAVDLSIPFVAALPFEKMGDRWPEESRRRRDHLLALAASVESSAVPGRSIAGSSFGTSGWSNAPRLTAGSSWTSGTAAVKAAPFATVRYAESLSLEVVNVRDEWRAP